MCWGVSANRRPQAASCGLFAAPQGSVGGGLAADRPRTSSAHNPHPALPWGRAFLPGGRLVLGDRRTTEERSFSVGWLKAGQGVFTSLRLQATSYRLQTLFLPPRGRWPQAGGVVRRGTDRPRVCNERPAYSALLPPRTESPGVPAKRARPGAHAGPCAVVRLPPARAPSSFGRKLPTTHRRHPSCRLSRAARPVRARIQSRAGPGSSPGQVRNLSADEEESAARSNNGDDGVSVHPRPTAIRSPTSALCASPGMTVGSRGWDVGDEGGT